VESFLFSLIIIGGGYLIGSIAPSAWIAKFIYKIDIKAQGSGNAGGANAMRLMGKKVGAVVVIVDILKGTAAIYLAQSLNPEFGPVSGFFADTSYVVALTGFAAVFGHCFSLFLKFKGGKGGATAAGVVLGIDPFSTLIIIIFWILIVGSTKFTSLGNVLAIFALPSLMKLRTGEAAYIALGFGIAFLIVFTHRQNINRLMSGTERKLGQKEKISN